MWSADTRARLLRGSDAEAAAAARIAAADEEWASFEASFSPSALAACGLSAGRNAFVSSLAVVIASAVWLSAADCFALVPLVGSCEQRAASPLSDGGGGLVNTSVDYDAGRCAVVLVATTRLAVGSRLVAADPQQRGAAELLLSTGGSEPGGFPGDTLAWRACLLPADRLYAAKAASLAAAGLAPDGQAFPFTGDALPNQLMGYLRLSRVTDAAELAAVRLDRDAPVSQLNEYEVLQLMLQEVRERLAGYEAGLEADDAIIEAAAQGGGGVSAEEAAAAGMRRCEKRLLAETAAGLRRRLAPIRGKPTKGGRMEAPNADILDIFSQLENITSAPRNSAHVMLFFVPLAIFSLSPLLFGQSSTRCWGGMRMVSRQRAGAPHDTPHLRVASEVVPRQNWWTRSVLRWLHDCVILTPVCYVALPPSSPARPSSRHLSWIKKANVSAARQDDVTLGRHVERADRCVRDDKPQPRVGRQL